MSRQPPFTSLDATTTLVALGANATVPGHDLSDRLNDALNAIGAAGCDIVATSRFFRTPCFPAGAGPDYLNAAIGLRTDLPAKALLALLHRIETAMGRVRRVRWGARTLDLDLLAMGDLVLPDAATFAHWRDLPPVRQRVETPETLILPHPRLQDRAFVLIPLLDIAPDWRHPVSGLTVRQMVDVLPSDEKNAVRPL
ncbi:2-amino-4-hydroxy-6-hydroxymethyldihydropteridine diphosphokinase [Oceaniglobus indicus]|uniref:2-amino-4-hydroxy-6- hydroxymethyldihydropteridine diphosphokinase n=1 Tax=Oceaniglobus indicus TaxID=2047749 RepID=UPI001F4D5436|nr:2-amino-4-hydroxy-6-hydroxymethyldihydropteridine diphosphokinase [Oceaniglobus indicus]